MFLFTCKLGLTLLLLCLPVCLSTTQKTRAQFEREFAENATVPKIVCYRHEPNYSEATCVVSKFNQTCNITLQSIDGVVGRMSRAVPFGKDRAIVLWYDRNATDRYLKFRVLNLSTCASGSESKLAIGKEDSYLSWAVSLTTYDASFDVFYVDQEQRKYCKRSFDAESGEAIGKLVCLDNNDAPPFYTSYFPVEPYTSSQPKGYVLLLPSYERTIDAWFVAPDDDFVQFAKFSRDLPVRRFAVSTTHDTITICIQMRLEDDVTLVNCTRFNIFYGSKKQQTELKLVDGAKVSDVFNLSDGGFLLTLSKRSPLDCHSGDGERVMKISKDNVTFFAINRTPVKCDCAPAYLKTRMFENERREYCLVTVCSSSYDAESAGKNARTECFSDRELAVKTFTV